LYAGFGFPHHESADGGRPTGGGKLVRDVQDDHSAERIPYELPTALGERLTMTVLTIDVGGTHVKMLASRKRKSRQFDSGTDLTPAKLVGRVRENVVGWVYDVISLGLPTPVADGTAMGEPGNLADGWVGFDFPAAFGCPVRVVNDAAMQALGAYSEGRMLFLGLGTGLGSALVVEHAVITLELGRLRFDDGEPYGHRLGKVGFERLGEKAWCRAVTATAELLREACSADTVVFGGGRAELVDPLPPHCRRGNNEDAFTGGFRLWEERIEDHDQLPPRAWRVIV